MTSTMTSQPQERPDDNESDWIEVLWGNGECRAMVHIGRIAAVMEIQGETQIVLDACVLENIEKPSYYELTYIVDTY